MRFTIWGSLNLLQIRVYESSDLITLHDSASDRFHQPVPIHALMLDWPRVKHWLRLVCPAKGRQRGVRMAHCSTAQNIETMVYTHFVNRHSKVDRQ